MLYILTNPEISSAPQSFLKDLTHYRLETQSHYSSLIDSFFLYLTCFVKSVSHGVFVSVPSISVVLNPSSRLTKTISCSLTILYSGLQSSRLYPQYITT